MTKVNNKWSKVQSKVFSKSRRPSAWCAKSYARTGAPSARRTIAVSNITAHTTYFVRNNSTKDK